MTSSPLGPDDDTSGCPRGHRCESCADEHPDVAVAVRPSPAGPACWTLCPPCARTGMAPTTSPSTQARAAAAHADHLVSPRRRGTWRVEDGALRR